MQTWVERFRSPVVLTSVAQSLTAVSALGLAYAVLQLGTTEQFGRYGCLLLIVTAGLLLLSALVQAPLLLLQTQAAQRHVSDIEHAVTSLLAVGYLLALSAAAVAGAMAWYFQFAWPTVLLAMLAVYLQLTRALQRSYLQHDGHFVAVARADVGAACMVLVLLGLLVWYERVDLTAAYALICASLLVWRYPNTPPVPTGFNAQQRHHWRTCYHSHGKAALKGAIWSELLSNSYSYTVPLWLGAIAYAPVVAAAYIFRPAAVVSQGMAQFYRVQFRYSVTTPDAAATLEQQSGAFKRQLWLAYAADAITAVLLLLCWPQTLWPDGATGEFVQVFVLTALIAALRLARQVPTLLLQAQGQFDTLARLQVSPGCVALVGSTLGALHSVAAAMLAVVLAELWLYLALRARAREISERG